MPVLEDLRERRKSFMDEMETLSKADTLTSEQRARFTQLDTDITELDEELAMRERQAEREKRAAEARAADSGGRRAEHDGEGRHENPSASGWSVTGEPTTYGRHSGHSFFLDMARIKAQRGDGDGGLDGAMDRLNRHVRETDEILPKRYEARNRAAEKAYEDAFARGSDHEKRAFERMITSGVSPFEKRAYNPKRESRFISRVDGAGGYFVPPVWLIDQYIPYLRAGRNFIDLCRQMPMPPGTDAINIPRITVGTATGAQVADGGPVQGRDMTDNFVTAPIRTIAGQQDAALQLLDQSPVVFDEIIFADLAADYNMQLDGQGLVGSGTNGQLAGIWPAGAISANTGVFVNNTNNNNTVPQTWVCDGTSATSVAQSVFRNSGQLLSLIARLRLKPPTHWLWHPWIWYYLTTNVDTTLRPLVVPGTPNNVGFNQVAVDTDGPEVMGPVGFYMGLPIHLDPNIPTSFGGTVAPSMGTISNGIYAPVPGSGGTPNYTPVLAGLFDDVFVWEGEMRSRVLSEVLSGNLQVRFQLYNYVAFLPNRYQAYSNTAISGTGFSGGVNANAPVSFGSVYQNTANGVLQIGAQGF